MEFIENNSYLQAAPPLPWIQRLGSRTFFRAPRLEWLDRVPVFGIRAPADPAQVAERAGLAGEVAPAGDERCVVLP